MLEGYVYSAAGAAGRLSLGLKSDMKAEGCEVFPAQGQARGYG